MRRVTGTEYLGSAERLALEMLRSLIRPIELIDEVVRNSRVGAPGKSARNFLIGQLRLVYRHFWGQEPTTTPSGQFALLCQLICDAIGADTEGVDKAIERVLARLRPSP